LLILNDFNVFKRGCKYMTFLKYNEI